MKTNKPVRVRYAPSPTGKLHIGGARTALYNYLLARQTNGQFILRIEDTDQKRYVQDAEQEFLQAMQWMGLQWDEGPDVGGPYAPYRQSERKAIYQEYAEQLLEEGKAFYCFCSPERLNEVRQQQQKEKKPYRYDGTCRDIPLEEAKKRVAAGESHVIRFKMPLEGKITVKDLLRGEMTVDYRTLDDYILVKSDGLALYHLAAMVDDHLMNITHVLRGSEWLPTFPLHAAIYRAFGWEEPIWVHLSVFLKPSGKGKMSKRDAEAAGKDGHSIFVNDLPGLGYLPEAANNWFALMGWSFDDHTEFFTMQDLIEKFSLERLNPSPAAINFSKFDHFNGLHIRSLPEDQLIEKLIPIYEKAGLQVDHSKMPMIVPIIRERMVTLEDAVSISGFFFRDDVNPEPDLLVAKKLTPAESAEVAQKALDVLKSLNAVDHDTAEPALRNLVEDLGLKASQVFGIVRSAVTGQQVSPPLFESMEIIGRDAVLQRIEKAISILKSLN